MIGRLTGTLVERGLETVVIDVGGVGYELSVPATTHAQLPPVGERCTLVVHTHLREDGITLFGFLGPRDRSAFRLLQTVSGIGPKVALAVLSGLSPADLAQAIARQEIARLKAIPGVGKKTAERICLELKDKRSVLDGDGATADATHAPRSEGVVAGGPAQVVAALVRMGYRPQEAERAVAESAAKLGVAASIEDLLRDSLVALVG